MNLTFEDIRQYKRSHLHGCAICEAPIDQIWIDELEYPKLYGIYRCKKHFPPLYTDYYQLTEKEMFIFNIL